MEFQDLKVCYEAGPTGFVLARRLRQLGLECVVMSPSKTERKPSEKVKTDKRDAKKIARKLSATATSPRSASRPPLDEAVRDVCRARTDASDDLSRAKQRLNSFLLRNGIRYPARPAGTLAHMRYLRELALPYAAQKIVLEEYIQAIDSGLERVERLAERMKLLLADWEWKPVVGGTHGLPRLPGSRRHDHHQRTRRSAPLRAPAQAHGLPRPGPRRTHHRDQAAARAPSPDAATHTPAGCLSNAPSTTASPQGRARLWPDARRARANEVRELSWRMQNRLHTRYVKLRARGKRDNKVIVAIARELCGFIWELQNKLNLPIPPESQT